MCHIIIHDLYMQSQDSQDRKPLVTVAMAVYNAAEFLEAAVNSILVQTFRNFELLLIDDGSNDRSKDICSRLALSDNRIRCIFKSSNDGLSVVRNLSVDEAFGKYLLMADADDLMDEHTIEKAVKKAEDEAADVVIWDYETFSGIAPQLKEGVSRLFKIDPADRMKLLTLPAFMPVRLIRTDYIRNRGWRFPKGLTKQDIPIHWSIVTDSNCRITLLPERMFYYRQQPNATSCRNGRSLFSLVNVMDIVETNLRETGVYETYKIIFWKKRLELLHGMYDFIKPELKEEAMQMILDRIDGDGGLFLKESSKLLTSRTRTFYRMIRGRFSARIRYNMFMGLRTIYRKLK